MNDETTRPSPEDLGTGNDIATIIRRIGLKTRQRGDEAARSLAVSAQQGQILGYIDAYESRGVIQREIADVSGLRPASVTSLLQGLEEQGYLERRANPRDARLKTLHLLPRGRAVIADFDAAIADMDRELLAPLTADEASTLQRLLLKVDAGFRSTPLPERPARSVPPEDRRRTR